MSNLEPDVEELLSSLKQAITAPEKQEMLRAVAMDVARLTNLALADPAAAEAEANIVKATMANLGSAEMSSVAMIWTEWSTNLITRVITKVMPV